MKKLVRDLIPAIIKNNGQSCEIRVLENEEYKEALRQKLQEEMQEYLTAKTNEETIGELADLLEVMYALTRCHESSREELERVRAKKEQERGAFRDKIFLEGISE